MTDLSGAAVVKGFNLTNLTAQIPLCNGVCADVMWGLSGWTKVFLLIQQTVVLWWTSWQLQSMSLFKQEVHDFDCIRGNMRRHIYLESHRIKAIGWLWGTFWLTVQHLMSLLSNEHTLLHLTPWLKLFCAWTPLLVHSLTTCHNKTSFFNKMCLIMLLAMYSSYCIFTHITLL